MTRITKSLWAVFGLSFLAACGNQSEPGLASQLGGRFIPALAAETESAVQPGAPSPETSMLFQIAGLGIVGLGQLVESSGGRSTYLGETGYSVTFEGDVMVATRGFGKDLMAADVSQVQAAIAQRGGTARRVHEYLDARDQVVQQSYECTLELKGTEEVDLGLRQVEARILSESCQNPRLVFENVYYLDSNGTVIASRQFVSDVIAYLRNNRL